MMIPYVLGFLFNHDDTEVVLIRKQRPDWAAGLLNGIGGKIEKGETGQEAMAREFDEEAGVWIVATGWREFGRLICPGHWEVLLFESRLADIAPRDVVRTTTDEEVTVVNMRELSAWPLVPSINWMIPMAIDRRYYSKVIKTS